MTRTRAGDVTGAALGVVAALRVGAEVRDLLAAPLSGLVARTPDDAWYYLTVARSLAGGDGATFDGHEATNGFHPLWQVVEAALAWVWHDAALARAALVCGVVVGLLGTAVWIGVLARAGAVGPFGAGVGAVVATSPPVLGLFADGMETPVVVLTSALLAASLARWWTAPTVRAWALVGLATGCTVLARVSTVAVLPVVAAGLVVVDRLRRGRPPARRSWRGPVAWTAATSAVVAPWFAWSWAVTGSPAQSSAAVKWRWARDASGPVLSGRNLRDAWSASTEELWRVVRLGLPWWADAPSGVRRASEVVVVALAVGLVLRAGRRTPVVLVALAPAALLAVRLGVEVVGTPRGIAPWYGAPLVVAAVVAATWVASLVERAVRTRAVAVSIRVRRVVGVVAGIAVLAAGLAVAAAPSGRPAGEWGSANLEAGRELHRRPGLRVGAYDAGVLGWTHPGVVNLDGLMRDRDSVDRLAATRPGDVPAVEGLDLLVGLMGPGDPRVPHCARAEWSSRHRYGVGGGPPRPVRIWDVSGCEVRGAGPRRPGGRR